MQRAQDEDRTCSDGNADQRIRVEQQGAYPRTDARAQCAYEVTAIVVFQRPEEGTAVAAYALDFALHLGGPYTSGERHRDRCDATQARPE